MNRPDKYARDAKTWLMYAEVNLQAARVLFAHESSLMLCFPAATLGHHSIEAFLKTALINQGFTVFDPRDLKDLDASVQLTKDRCAWGHELAKLGRILASSQPKFDLSAELSGTFFPREMPMTIEVGLGIFDPFFWELRYPQALKNLDTIGPGDVALLNALVKAIRPFVETAQDK